MTLRVVALSLVFTCLSALRAAEHRVSDAATAIRIAVGAWEPVYGSAHIARERPFHAALHHGVWTVTGSLPHGMKGGVAIAEISEADGSIIRIAHGK
jgi:hypothetical protein